VEVFDSAVSLIRQARARGVRTAVASSSRTPGALLGILPVCADNGGAYEKT
jgi:hypothetical protein